jgi:hypothetical protein
MAAGQNFSYSFQNQIRDLSGLIHMTILNMPVFLSLVPIAATVAKNHKHEWLEDQLTPQQDTTAASALVGDGTLTVTTQGSYKVGDLWVNTSTDERFLVTSVAANPITITRGVGSTAVAMANGDKLRLVSRPQDEGSDPSPSVGHEAAPVFNYTQIFDRTALVTESALATSMYGIDDLMEREVMLKADEIAREMNMTSIWGVKNQRTGTGAAQKGRMDGLFAFLDQAGANRIDAAGGVLAKTMLNDALEKAFLNGAGKLVAICGTKQARAITATDSNYRIMREDTTNGKRILEYQGDMAGNNTTPAAIVVEPSYSAKRVDFVDVSRIQLVPMRPLEDKDATPPGSDYASRRLLGEYTLEVKNAKQAHATVFNLG